MKKLFVVMALATFVAATSGFAFSADGDADPQKKGQELGDQKKGEDKGEEAPLNLGKLFLGGAPCSGDGIPDGPTGCLEADLGL